MIAPQHAPTGPESRTQNLMLGALGVVFGDIGTSPLYTMQICMAETGDVTHSGVMGILSLIVWALIIVVTLKYVVVVMRADNRGEGGILALTALALRGVKSGGRLAALVLAAGMAGCCPLLRRWGHHPGHLGALGGRGAEDHCSRP